MSVNLSKGQTVSLESSGGTLTQVRMGLGWDAAKKHGLFGSRSQTIDLDASALLFDAGKLVDQVWFQQLVSTDGSVQHTGDNLTGEGEGDDESITRRSRQRAAGGADDRVHRELVHRAGLLPDRERVLPSDRRVERRRGGPLRPQRIGTHTAQIMAKVSRDGAAGR